MRSARMFAVWAAAAWVALTVLVRISRGEVVMLSSYAAPVVRLVAVVLVFLMGCAEKLRPGESGEAPAQSGELSQGTAPQGKPGEAQAQPNELSQGTAPQSKPGGSGEGSEVAQGTGSAPTPVITVEPVLPVPEAFPDNLTDEALQATYNWIEPRGLWQRVMRAQTAGTAVTFGDLLDDPNRQAAAKLLVAEVEGFLARQKKGEPETAATLRGLLVAAEGVPLFDAWLAGFVWLHARTISPAPVDVYARVERHLRVAHAMVLAQATTGRIEFSAWRSKAGPPPGWRKSLVPAGLAKATRREFDSGADAGLWETAAVLSFKVGSGSIVLVRRARETNIAAGAAVRLRRLDVIRAPEGATLVHAKLGPLVLARGAEVTAWNVGESLGADGRARVQALVEAALGGDEAALAKLEAVLPAAHAAIRAAVQARPDAPGAAGLRTLLTAFDE
jgi:hypothetical protein